MNTEQRQNSDGSPALAPAGLLGAMYRGSDGAMTCALCHCEMEWVECQAGCEDGYDQVDLAPCSECGGQGGSWWCPNDEAHTPRADD